MYSPPGPNPGPQQPLQIASLKGAPGFVNPGGFTVYVFNGDLNAPGTSACNGQCAQNWPPVAGKSGSLPSGWSNITRQDGSSQLAYNGRPLYTFVVDTQPGQTNGDGVVAFGATWYISRPQAAPSPMPSGY